MKHAKLQAIVHNVADSLGSGISLMTGFYDLDVYRDAHNSPGKTLRLDLLGGVVMEGDARANLIAALQRVPEALAAQCTKAGVSWDDFHRAEVVYRVDTVGPGFTILVEDRAGKSTETDYMGSPAKREKALDAYGRVVPKPSRC
ncbi:hypothetical protein NX862_16770 [Rhodobacter sp. KR11]|uniref:hypothetical protein n=1 Tax=Rhodobacter sp. KR11 TaxID=2974588 RepID=UPI00222280B0|nr:hypothetical protein [Rhodobacter sp. KR11]MCW1920417.1 hypothetical protein [Rhodobacter sp. KR11]